MADQYPSIFNDVIGPVMRGPSSSHSAASVRIGRMARDLMDGDIEEVLIEYEIDYGVEGEQEFFIEVFYDSKVTEQQVFLDVEKGPEACWEVIYNIFQIFNR